MENISKVITPHLWFDKEARQAIEFYISLFENSSINTQGKMDDTPSGAVEIISFSLWGKPFVAMNAGPMFKFNQAISFFVYCGSEEKIDRLYKALSEGGKVMMELNKYDWSGKYAWVQDR